MKSSKTDEPNEFLSLGHPNSSSKADFNLALKYPHELEGWQGSQNMFGLSENYRDQEGILTWGQQLRFQSEFFLTPANTNQEWSAPKADIPDLFSMPNTPPNKLQLTDASNGLFLRKKERNLSELAQSLAKTLDFAEIDGKLAVYQSPSWQLLSTKKARRFISNKLARYPGEVVYYLNSGEKNEIVQKILDLPGIFHLDGIPEPDYHMLCGSDGMYCWPEGNKYLPSSKHLRFSHLEVSTHDIEPCQTPYFDRFLESVAQDDDALRQLILEVIGVIVTGFPTKHFFVFEGVTSSGKSQLANFLKDVLGLTACVAVNGVNQLSEKWTTGGLPGKLLCICADVPDKPLNMQAVAVIKELTGDDAISGERKYEDPFTFKNTAKLLFLSNAPLRVCGGNIDEAFQRRMVQIPFRYTVPEEDQIPYLHKRLFDEVGGILWKALRALELFEKRNGVFTPIKAEHGGNEMLYKSGLTAGDRVVDFVQACCCLEESATSNTQSLYHAFLCYERKQYGDTASVIPSSLFGRTLLACGLPIKSWRNATTRGYRGIRLTDGGENISSV